MSHRYEVYDVDLAGNKHYTGKIVEVVKPPTFDGYSIIDRGSVVQDLFKLFGFTQYIANYTPRRVRDTKDDIELTYHYISLGERPTWYLKKGS